MNNKCGLVLLHDIYILDKDLDTRVFYIIGGCRESIVFSQADFISEIT